MSDLFANPREVIPLMVLLASLSGSFHCVGMCGGLSLAVAPRGKQAIAYHLSRWLGYLSLGAWVGWIGQQAFREYSSVSAVLIGLMLFVTGLQLVRGRSIHMGALPQSWVSKAMAFARGRASLTGFLSVLLPCGWLHVFVLGAATTQDPIRGALLLSLFWLGTVPAFFFVHYGWGKLAKRFKPWMGRYAGVLFVLAGFYSVFAKTGVGSHSFHWVSDPTDGTSQNRDAAEPSGAETHSCH